MTRNQIVLTGANGQLGLTMQALWPESRLSDEFELLCTDIDEMDITSEASINSVLDKNRVATVINGAAYTAVDKAETETELAFSINQRGAENLAAWVKGAGSGCHLIHISTDFVFSGNSTTPYKPLDKPSPLGVYGESKLAGERAVMETVADAALILRTSWLYSPFQSNFVKTMLRLIAERDALSVVSDQIGSPTSTYSLAELLMKMLEEPTAIGVYHWSDSGNISWYDFALEIQALGIEAGILKNAIPIHPVSTQQYPTPAARPKFSVLDISETQAKFGLNPDPWQERLRYVINRLAKTS